MNFSSSGGSVEELDIIIRTLQKFGNDVVVVTAFSKNNQIPHNLPYKIVEENISATDLLGIQLAAIKLLKKYETQADFFHIDGHLFLYGAGIYRRLKGSVPVAALFNSYLAGLPDNLITSFAYPTDGLIGKIKKKIRYLAERYLGMWLAKSIDLCAFVSPPLQKVYENFGLRAKRHMVIGDLIDFDSLKKENNIFCGCYSERKSQDGLIKILFSSRMIRGKGFDLLLDGFSLVKDKHKFRLIIGGSGPDEHFVVERIKKLSLEPYVEIPGWVAKEKLFDYYRQADIFAQVGWKPEGTSISLLYAMLFGIPSILPRGGGLEWQAGNCAIYVNNGNPEELASAIELLGNDESLRKKLSDECYNRIGREQFNCDKMVGYLFNEIEKINKRSKIT